MNNVKRVLHIVGGMNTGGAESLIMNIYRRIDRTRIQFDFAVHTESECDFDDEIRSLGGRIYPHKRATGSGRQFVKALANTIRNNGPFHAVHSHVHFFSGLTLKTAYEEKVPVRIAHSHTNSDGKGDTFLRNLYRRLMREQIRRYATHCLAVSNKAGISLYGPLDRCNFKVINGIDLMPYRKCYSDRLPDIPTIVHIGRFVEVKNHKFILEVFHRFLKKNPTSRLKLVGDGPLLNDVKNDVRKREIDKHVDFLGTRTDIAQILSRATLLLMPSLYEGGPLTVLEAQASGIRCLASDRISEEVDVGLGLVVIMSLDQSAEAWADTLEGLLTRYEKMEWPDIEIGFHQAGRTIDKVVEELVQIYA